MQRVEVRPGDYIIYRKTKHSEHPGPRAANIHPARHGDTYVYTVDKYWLVEDVQRDGTIVAVTRRGKRHFLKPGDPLIQRANWFQKLFLRHRFPEPTLVARAG